MAILLMEKSVQSWVRRLVFCHHLITLSALTNTFGGIVLNTLRLWESFSPKPKRILRRVMIRDGIPFSIRSTVKGEILARFANLFCSAFRFANKFLPSIANSSRFFSGSSWVRFSLVLSHYPGRSMNNLSVAISGSVARNKILHFTN
jgi:hypothetical protein